MLQRIKVNTHQRIYLVDWILDKLFSYFIHENIIIKGLIIWPNLFIKKWGKQKHVTN